MTKSTTMNGDNSSIPATPPMPSYQHPPVPRHIHTRPRHNMFLRKPLWALNIDDGANPTASPNLARKSSDETLTDRSCSTVDDMRQEDVGFSIRSNNTGGSQQKLERHLGLFDLVSLGIGGTVGSGIFVLSGLVANQYSGPAVTVSWALAGAAASLSGVCYAELAGQIPASGSSYAYVYAAIGEFPAFIAAAGLTLEYVISGAAVARSWGDKMSDWLIWDAGVSEEWVDDHLRGLPLGFNPMAAVIATASVAVLVAGVRESRAVTNIFTVTKLLIIAFMVLGGAVLMKSSNFSPYVPTQYGLTGVFRGTTSCFFGYIGYDEICCMAGEAVNPRRNLPRAILLTLACVTTCYMAASAVLVGMVPYYDISTTSGFPDAFAQNGATLASQISSFGEVLTLPIVVLVSLMAQPRLMYALACDGLVPAFFGEVDAHGSLTKGTLASGAVMVIVASFVPFTSLNDMISAGILICFSLTNSSLILMRLSGPESKPGLLGAQVGFFNGAAVVCSLLIVHFWESLLGKFFVAVSVAMMVGSCLLIKFTCPEAAEFGGNRPAVTRFGSTVSPNHDFFRAPLVPFLPCAAIFVNSCLLAQLELDAMLILALYLILASVLYFLYGTKYSVGNRFGWRQELQDTDNDNGNGLNHLIKQISLPYMKKNENYELIC